MKKIIDKIKIFIKECFYYLCFLIPIKKNRIVADNFWGKNFGDNPGAIIEDLLSKNKNIEVYWALDSSIYDTTELPLNIKKVKFGSIQHYYVLATSKVWLDNVRCGLLIKKRRGIYYIQTWHGAFGFKQIEKAIEDKLPKHYIKMAKNDSKNMDLLITNSKWQDDYFKKIFYYEGEILRTGYPRNDVLFNNSKHDVIKERVYRDLKIKKNIRTILYAPTFRDDHDMTCYNIDYNRLLEVLTKKTNSKWKLLIRLHPNISNLDISIKNNDNIINVSNYPNVNNLMIATDMLISDYSSVVFEFSYLSKPIVLYASDMEKYRIDRGLLFEYDELPFPYATNNDELEKVIKNLSKDAYQKKLKEFYKKHCLIEDGNASDRISKIILKKINE